MAERRILLTVDLSYQCYRACAARPMLKSMDETFTGGLFGFMESVAKIIRESEATDVVVCADRKPYLRSKVYPEYKQLRNDRRDEELLQRHKASMPLIEAMLECCGIPVWALPGFEADDLSGHAVRKYKNRFDFIYAATNDSDLFQLLDCENFGIFRTSDKKDVMTGKRLRETLGVTPAEHMLASAVRGTHNDIAGIPGVGEVTALKIAKEPSLLRKYRDGYANIIDRNLALIKLPHPALRREEVMPGRTGDFDQRALYRFCGQYDIDCTMSMVDAFRQVARRH